jgi:hypothetical protein
LILKNPQNGLLMAQTSLTSLSYWSNRYECHFSI